MGRGNYDSYLGLVLKTILLFYRKFSVSGSFFSEELLNLCAVILVPLLQVNLLMKLSINEQIVKRANMILHIVPYIQSYIS